MKKNIITIAAAALVLAACSSTKSVNDKVSLNGEWNIVEVNGVAVDTAKTETAPFLGFDTKKNEIHGCAGCNSLTGKVNIDEEKQTVDLSTVGTTMMLCSDMETEKNVLEALDKVKGYKANGENGVELTDAEGKTVISLQQK